MKNIKIITLLFLFSIIAIKANAGVDITKFIIDSQYLTNNLKLRLNPSGETSFTAKFTVVKGIEIGITNAVLEVILQEGSTQTVISNQLTRYSGDWPSQNNVWEGAIDCKLPAGKKTGDIYLRLTRYEGSVKSAVTLSVTKTSLDGPTVPVGPNRPAPATPAPDIAGAIPFLEYYGDNYNLYYLRTAPQGMPPISVFRGLLGYGAPENTPGSVPLYWYSEYKNPPADEYYTINKQEYERLTYNSTPFNVFTTQITGTKPIYCHWNPITKTHRYMNAPGMIGSEWVFEDVKFYMYQNKQITTHPLPEVDCEELYEYYNYGKIDHYLTTKKMDYGDWKYVKVLGYISTIQKPNTVPLYQYYANNKTDHYYTTTKKDYGEWIYEGILGYVYAESQPTTVPIYEFYDYSNFDHYFTPVNRNYPGYGAVGLRFHILPYPY
ncbi:hypothetical protein [Pedobacter sp. UYP1]|uniref:hypothetical protein n=1 Tax=Pedobacter sp. UYP1 TaxID=1756396 RepID=UPI003398508A